MSSTKVVSWDPAGKVVKVQFPHLVEAAAAERAEAPASFAARAGANPAPDGVCSYQVRICFGMVTLGGFSFA